MLLCKAKTLESAKGRDTLSSQRPRALMRGAVLVRFVTTLQLYFTEQFAFASHVCGVVPQTLAARIHDTSLRAAGALYRSPVVWRTTARIYTPFYLQLGLRS